MKARAVAWLVTVLVLAAAVRVLASSGGELGPDDGVVDGYVSEWRVIEPGEAAAFEHGLGERPLRLQVWVAHYVRAGEGMEFNEAVPWTDWAGDRPLVETVNQDVVIVYNPGDVFVIVQVVAW